MKVQIANFFKWNTLLNIVLFLFIFLMINREFRIQGFDLRFLLVFCSLLLVFRKMVFYFKGRNRLDLGLLEILICIFYVLAFFSNVFMLGHEFAIAWSSFMNLLILYLFNFVLIIVFIFYKKEISAKKDILYMAIKISTLILMGSVLWLWLGNDLSFLMPNFSGYVSGDFFRNFLGQPIRVAGFAQDPNYATFSFIIAIILTLKFGTKSDRILMPLYFLGIMFSASTTITIAFILTMALFCLIDKRIWRLDITFNKVKDLCISFIPVLSIIGMAIGRLLNDGSATSMSMRFDMWYEALNLFRNNVFFGNGLSSFRNYYLSSGRWYVQVHNTYLQILAETGIISLVLLILIFIILCKNKNKYLNVLIFTYMIWALTYETVYLLFFPFIIYFVPILFDENEKREEKALFVVNSLGKGGAERVVANIACEMAKDMKVEIVIFARDDFEYELPEGVAIIPIESKSKFKIINVLIKWIKFNNYLLKQQNLTDYKIITSHLPYSNLMCKFSNISNQTLYVIHNVFSAIENNNVSTLSRILRFIYNDKKIITVSLGVKNELVDRYAVKTNMIKVIYNPINLFEIKKLMIDEVEIDKYILFCGRLTDIKRPELLLNAYYQFEIFKDYKLVYLGTGELDNNLKKRVNYLKLNDRVEFLGWQDNVYKYMKNAELLVVCSKFESFSMTIVESFAVDCKVVSVDCDFGPREILKGEYGEYLARNNGSDLGKKIKMALDRYPANMRDIAVKYDVKNIINQYHLTYQNWNNV